MTPAATDVTLDTSNDRQEPDVTITLNGEPYEVPGRLPLSALLARLGIDPRRVAVERNLAVVRRAAFEHTVVDEGDAIEIVNFVGGGAR